ncbi:MAG: hypothetical protein EXQ58_01355 [Acidobacteria bacterium]|nr:hypothetical protein [Acidobacteriota bacterium]
MGIFLAALTLNNAVRNSMLSYFVVYVPVRVVEWSLMLLILRRQGAVPHYAAWVAGGVVVSCLADIPWALWREAWCPSEGPSASANPP